MRHGRQRAYYEAQGTICNEDRESQDDTILIIIAFTTRQSAAEAFHVDHYHQHRRPQKEEQTSGEPNEEMVTFHKVDLLSINLVMPSFNR